MLHVFLSNYAIKHLVKILSVIFVLNRCLRQSAKKKKRQNKIIITRTTRFQHLVVIMVYVNFTLLSLVNHNNHKFDH